MLTQRLQSSNKRTAGERVNPAEHMKRRRRRSLEKWELRELRKLSGSEKKVRLAAIHLRILRCLENLLETSTYTNLEAYPTV